MITAQSIINDARFKVITHIVTLMRKLDAYFETGKKNLMTDPEEGVVIDFADCEKVPYIRVEVDNSYLDVEDRCYELQPLSFIATSDDCNFYVGVGDTDETEVDIDADDISTDELLAIAVALEDTYNSK
jgi:hypothetical protein